MKETQRKRNVGWLCLLTAVVLAVAFAVPARAALERVGPVNAAIGGYPAWYQDGTGLALEFCTPVNQAELNGGWCTILPADVPTGAVPEVPFTNYSGEHFYWIASAGNRTDGLLVLALEAAFNTADPAAGEQIVFGRLRITISSLPASGDYRVYTPFGNFIFPGLVAGDRLFFTSDIGITCGADFSCALNSNIGPFLLPSATPGGAEMQPLTATNPTPDTDPAHFGGGVFTPTPYPGTGKSYIADPARIGPVTGSPLGQNYFRIERPDGSVFHQENFSLGGRVMTASIPGRVDVKRASYTDQTTPTVLKKLDVFATAFPTVQGRLPGGALLPSTSPDLGFYPAPCATDPVTGAVTGPPTGTGLVYYQMFKGGNNWWGQHQPSAIPTQVCVQDHNSRNALGQVVPAYYMGNVTDEVDLTVADWNPAVDGGTLTVQAASSDQVTQPLLTVDGFGPMTAGSFIVSNLAAPPDKVSVTSTRGGLATLDVRTGIGIPVSMTTPVANADTVTINEDCAATPALSCATPPAPINVLANDTLNGFPFDPATASVVITPGGTPRLGTAVVDINPGSPTFNRITYTPNPNANGTDIVGYTVTVGGFTSNEGYLTVIITPVNDLPVANNDTAGAPNNRPVTINVLANDTDPDGAADLTGGQAAAVIQSLPAAGATLTCNGAPATIGTACAGGTVTFTATSVGTYSFTYKAQDAAGATSLNTANVSVTVNATENIVVTRSQFVSKTWRWTVSGTDSVPTGQTLTIKYDITTPPTYKVNGVCTAMTAATNPVIGTATVDALGNWTYDVLGTSAGLTNPTNTGSNGTGFWCSPPKAVRVTSPLGGAASSNISFK